MIRMLYLFSCIVLINNVCAKELSDSGKAFLKRYNIEEYFSGFSFSNMEDGGGVKIHILPGTFDDKKLQGITIDISPEGNLRKIKPVFERVPQAFEPSSWAFDAFKRNDITVDSLWEVLVASFPDNTSKKEILILMLATLERSDGYPSLNMVSIPPHGRLQVFLKELGRDPKANFGNLEEAKKLVEY